MKAAIIVEKKNVICNDATIIHCTNPRRMHLIVRRTARRKFAAFCVIVRTKFLNCFVFCIHILSET